MTGRGTIPDVLAWAKPEDVGLSRERLARIGEVLGRDIAAGTLPGAVTLVARDGRIVHFKAHGRRAPGLPDPMERDAIFRIYSMTKPIASVALLRYVEEGRLSLSDPLSSFVPAFAGVEVLDGEDAPRRAPTRPITLHDLLRHTSGLTYEWNGSGPVQRLYAKARAGRRSQTNADLAAILAGLPLAADPGSCWIYGRSTDVIGRVLEIVSGQSLGAHLRERVFDPVGMPDTGFHVPDAAKNRLAEPLTTDPDSGEPTGLMNVGSPPPLEEGGGGLVSTASDYARFCHMLLAGGAIDGQRLLSPATIAWMTADHLDPATPIGSDLLPPGYGFGLGVAVRRTAGLAPFPGSVGDVFWEGLGGTSFWIDAAEGLYALVMVQAPGRRAQYRRLMRQLVYGALVA